MGYSAVPFFNYGTLLITNASNFSLNGGGTNYGNIIMDPGSTLICSNAYSFAPGTVSGGGTLINDYAGLALTGNIRCGQFLDKLGSVVTGALNATNTTFYATTRFTNNGSLSGAISIFYSASVTFRRWK